MQFHLDVQEEQLRSGMRPGDQGFALDPEDHHGILTTIEDGKPVRRVHPTIEPPTYVDYYRILSDALKESGDIPVKAEDARDVLRIIELAKQSSDEGRTIDVSG